MLIANWFPFSAFFTTSLKWLYCFYRPLWLPQVIYKKFQIDCPLKEYSANSTASHLSFNLSSHDHEQEDDPHCSAYMFTMNSQVDDRGEDPVRLLDWIPDWFHTWMLDAV